MTTIKAQYLSDKDKWDKDKSSLTSSILERDFQVKKKIPFDPFAKRENEIYDVIKVGKNI
jgi:hypothetical protein